MKRKKEEDFAATGIIAHLVLASFFTLACFVNRNDADWYIWMPIYLVPGILCLLKVLKPSVYAQGWLKSLVNSLFVGCFVYGVYEVFALSQIFAEKGVMNPFAFEEGRELGGLAIIVVWSGLTIRPHSENKTSKPASYTDIYSLVPWVLSSLAVLPLGFWALCYIPSVGKTMGHCNNMIY